MTRCNASGSAAHLVLCYKASKWPREASSAFHGTPTVAIDSLK